MVLTRLTVWKQQKQAGIMKVLASFFIIILIFTFISRAIDGMLLSKVQVGTANSGNLSFTVKGEGVIQSKVTKYLTIPKGCKVDHVLQPGTKIEAGQPIVFLNTEQLKEQKKVQEAELRILKLSLEQEKLTGKANARLSEQEAVFGDLNLAERKYQEAADKLQIASNEYEQGVAERQEELSKAIADEADKLKQATPETYDEAKQAYDNAVGELEQSFRSYEQEQRAQLDSAIEYEKSMYDALEQAQNAMDIAAKNDANTEQNEQNAADISEKSQEMKQVEIEMKQDDIKKIDALLEVKGEIKADVAGVVTESEITPGAFTTGEELVGIGLGGYNYIGAFTKEDSEYIEEGDTIEITFQATNDPVSGKITNLNLNPTTNPSDPEAKETSAAIYGKLTVELGEGDYVNGSTANFSLTKESETYRCIIPMESIREDANGKYCLIVEKETTVLGESDVAKRIMVTSIKNDDKNAAIEETVTRDDFIIISSSKNVKEGDRVRIQ